MKSINNSLPSFREASDQDSWFEGSANLSRSKPEKVKYNTNKDSEVSGDALKGPLVGT